MPKISIIVPLYNAEKYLPKNIESILNQTFFDFELLLINDGSNDNSGRLCDEYGAKDQRIKVFHKPNGGVSSARNLGIKNTHGEYVMFVDADDWIEKDCLQVLYDTCCSDDLDFLQFSFRTVNYKRETMNVYSDETQVLPLQEYIKKDVFLVCIGGTIIKKSTIHNNRLSFREDLKLAEDQLFILTTMFHSNRMKRIPYVFYNYFQNEGSATKNAKFKDITNSIIALNEFEYRQIFKKHIDRMIVLQTNVALNSSKCNIVKFYQVAKNISINPIIEETDNISIRFLKKSWNNFSFLAFIIIRTIYYIVKIKNRKK